MTEPSEAAMRGDLWEIAATCVGDNDGPFEPRVIVENIVSALDRHAAAQRERDAKIAEAETEVNAPYPLGPHIAAAIRSVP